MFTSKNFRVLLFFLIAMALIAIKADACIANYRLVTYKQD